MQDCEQGVEGGLRGTVNEGWDEVGGGRERAPYP